MTRLADTSEVLGPTQLLIRRFGGADEQECRKRKQCDADIAEEATSKKLTKGWFQLGLWKRTRDARTNCGTCPKAPGHCLCPPTCDVLNLPRLRHDGLGMGLRHARIAEGFCLRRLRPPDAMPCGGFVRSGAGLPHEGTLPAPLRGWPRANALRSPDCQKYVSRTNTLAAAGPRAADTSGQVR